jgi:hypothetical protein
VIDCGGSWSYIQGAGDDEENWAQGLKPDKFWSHAEELLAASPAACELYVHVSYVFVKLSDVHGLFPSQAGRGARVERRSTCFAGQRF